MQAWVVLSIDFAVKIYFQGFCGLTEHQKLNYASR